MSEWVDSRKDGTYLIHKKWKELINGYARAPLFVVNMIDKIEVVNKIGSGELLFHNKMSVDALLHEINKQLAVCENSDENYCYRIKWEIIYGKKFAC